MSWPALLRRPGRLGGALLVAGAVSWAAAGLWTGRNAAQPPTAMAQLATRLPAADAPGVAPGVNAADAATATGGASATDYGELERHLKRQPRDGRALVFKARMDAEAGRFEQAAQGYAEATRVATRVARDPGIWVEYAEARGMAQGGSLIGEPEQLLQRALDLDARHAQALDLSGSAAWERRHYAQAAALWQRLLAQTPAGSERHAALVKAIGRAEMLAKVSLPPRP
jgi:cytochrome c-type biogenesis protein CcmH